MKGIHEAPGYSLAAKENVYISTTCLKTAELHILVKESIIQTCFKAW